MPAAPAAIAQPTGLLPSSSAAPAPAPAPATVPNAVLESMPHPRSGCGATPCGFTKVDLGATACVRILAKLC